MNIFSAPPLPAGGGPESRDDAANAKYLQEVEDSVVSLFTDNDYKPFLRFSRRIVRKRPDLIHRAIDNDHSDLLCRFIPGSQVDLFQPQNELGESALLHAVRRLRLDVVSKLLERKQVAQLFNDTNNYRQNILHMAAMQPSSEPILNLLIDYCLGKAIDIGKTFDTVDEDGYTPLQLSIMHNNLPAVRMLLNHCDKTAVKMYDGHRENLVHLAVRYGNVAMLEHLLHVDELSNQDTGANSSITPIELARSIKRKEMVEYLSRILPPSEFDRIAGVSVD